MLSENPWWFLLDSWSNADSLIWFILFYFFVVVPDSIVCLRSYSNVFGEFFNQIFVLDWNSIWIHDIVVFWRHRDDEQAMENVCRSCVQSVGEDGSLGYDWALPTSPVLYPSRLHLYRCVLHWRHWLGSHRATLQGPFPFFFFLGKIDKENPCFFRLGFIYKFNFMLLYLNL